MIWRPPVLCNTCHAQSEIQLLDFNKSHFEKRISSFNLAITSRSLSQGSVTPGGPFPQVGKPCSKCFPGTSWFTLLPSSGSCYIWFVWVIHLSMTPSIILLIQPYLHYSISWYLSYHPKYATQRKYWKACQYPPPVWSIKPEVLYVTYTLSYLCFTYSVMFMIFDYVAHCG